MTPVEIRDAIAASPDLQSLGEDTFAIAEAISAGRTNQDGVTKFSSLGIAERFPALGPLPGPLAAEMVLQKLEGFATAAQQSADTATKLLGAATARQMRHLEGSGMAIGSPAVAAMLGVIVQSGALTQIEADALTSIAAVSDPISELEVRRACWADNGDWRA